MKITAGRPGETLIHSATGETIRIVSVFTMAGPDGASLRAADCETGGEIFRIDASAGGLGAPDVWRREGGQS